MMLSMRTFLSLLRLAAPLICVGMILFTVVALTCTAPGLLVANPWVLAPYVAVGIISFLARKNWVAALVGFIAALVTAWLGIFLLYDLPRCADSGKRLEVGLVLLIQWGLIGIFGGMGLIGILIQKGIGVLITKSQQRSE